MAYEELLRSISLDADASVGIYTGVPGQPGSASPNGGKQYHFVKLTGKNTVGLAADADAAAVIGVLQNKPQTPGSASTVAIGGVSLVVAGEAIPAASSVTVGATGQGKPAGAGTVLGWALEAATAAGELVPVLLKK